MRDLIDIRDAIEAVVPFAKRLSWVTRRLAGLVTSTIGAVALGVMSGNQAGGRGRAGRGKRGVMMSAGGAQGVRQIDSSEWPHSHGFKSGWADLPARHLTPGWTARNVVGTKGQS